MKRLAINKNGDMTYCTAPEDKIGQGRCNHILHQLKNETAEEFTKRAELFIKKVNKSVKVNMSPTIDNLESDAKLEGLQNKWFIDNCYIKEDMDKEIDGVLIQERDGLSEELLSIALDFTNLEHANYKSIAIFDEDGNDTGKIGVSSENFLKEDETLFSLSDLLSEEQGKHMISGESNDYTPQFNELKSIIHEKTGLDIHSYLLKIISLDLITMNPDRHLGNISLIRNKKTNEWKFAPIYDNGQALLANKEFDNADEWDFWDYEEHQTPSTFGMGPVDDYFDLILNNMSSKDAIEIDFDGLEKTINNYSNDLYESKYVERSKQILLQRLEEYEGTLWKRKGVI